jgi:hypothetical protein
MEVCRRRFVKTLFSREHTNQFGLPEKSSSALSWKKARRAPRKTSIFCEEIYGREEVDRFLAKFTRYFRTKKYKQSGPPPRRPRPVYHRVVLFELRK